MNDNTSNILLFHVLFELAKPRHQGPVAVANRLNRLLNLRLNVQAVEQSRQYVTERGWLFSNGLTKEGERVLRYMIRTRSL